MKNFKLFLLTLTTLSMVACSGGGGGDTGPTNPNPTDPNNGGGNNGGNNSLTGYYGFNTKTGAAVNEATQALNWTLTSGWYDKDQSEHLIGVDEGFSFRVKGNYSANTYDGEADFMVYSPSCPSEIYYQTYSLTLLSDNSDPSIALLRFVNESSVEVAEVGYNSSTNPISFFSYTKESLTVSCSNGLVSLKDTNNDEVFSGYTNEKVLVLKKTDTGSIYVGVKPESTNHFSSGQPVLVNTKSFYFYDSTQGFLTNRDHNQGSNYTKTIDSSSFMSLDSFIYNNSEGNGFVSTINGKKVALFNLAVDSVCSSPPVVRCHLTGRQDFKIILEQ